MAELEVAMDRSMMNDSMASTPSASPAPAEVNSAWAGVPGSGGATAWTEEHVDHRMAHVRAEAPREVELPAPRGPEGRTTYGWIDFAGLPNTRDLGGLVGADGRRIKPGLLLRSGALCFGTDEDVTRLRDVYRVRLVVDLRNAREVIEQPDPMDELPGARFIHADILARSAEGITQEEDARKRIARERAALDHASLTRDDDDFMLEMYRYLLLSETGRAGYRALMQGILGLTEGTALWHCFVGRDRCGMASMLVELALGVAWEDIVADYLATNIFAPDELTFSYPARRALIEAARSGVLQEYGDFDAYFERALDVTAADIAELRHRYLA